MTSRLENLIDDVNDSLRKQLFARGATGLTGVARAFRIADFDESGALGREEFEQALSYAGLFLKEHEISALFRFYDKDGSGDISYDEFLTGLAGEMNERRLRMVSKVFDMLDRDRSGTLTVSDIQERYSAAKHPRVRAGEVSEEEVLGQFLETFEEDGTDGDGRVSRDSFISYYTRLSASVPSDDYFIDMLESAFMLREREEFADLDRTSRLCKLLRDKIRERSHGSATSHRVLLQQFKYVDSDESGRVTVDEFKAAMERFGIPLSREDTGSFFRLLDKDGSGTVSYAEFVEWACNDS